MVSPSTIPICSKRLPDWIAFSCTPTIFPSSYFGRIRAWEKSAAGLLATDWTSSRDTPKRSSARRWTRSTGRFPARPSPRGAPAARSSGPARRARRPRFCTHAGLAGGVLVVEGQLLEAAAVPEHDAAPLDADHLGLALEPVLRRAPRGAGASPGPRPPPRTGGRRRRRRCRGASAAASSPRGPRSRARLVLGEQAGVEEVAVEDRLAGLPGASRSGAAAARDAGDRPRAGPGPRRRSTRRIPAASQQQSTARAAFAVQMTTRFRGIRPRDSPCHPGGRAGLTARRGSIATGLWPSKRFSRDFEGLVTLPTSRARLREAPAGVTPSAPGAFPARRRGEEP